MPRAAPTRHSIAPVWVRIPLDMNILRAVKRSPLGLDLYLCSALVHNSIEG